jgi:MFS family permease
MSHISSVLNLPDIKKNNRRILYIVNILHGTVLGFWNTLYQYHLLTLTDQNEFLVGVIQSTGFLLMLVMMLVSGLLAEKIGKKIIILIGTGMFISGFAVLIVGSSILLLIVGSMLAFGGFGCLDPSWVTVISENSDDHNKGMVYGLIFFFYFGGSIIGSLMVSWLEKYDFVYYFGESSAPFYFLISIGLLSIEGLIQGFFLKVKKSPPEHDETSKPDKKKIWMVYFHDKAMLLLLGFFILDAFVWGNFIQLYYTSLLSTENGFALDEGDLALYVVFVMNLSNLLLQIPAGWLVDKIGPKISLFISELSGLICIILNIIIWFFRDQVYVMLIISQVFLALAIVPFQPAQNKILTKIHPKRTAEVYGFMNFSRNIFWLGAGYINGWNLRTFGFIGPLMVGVIGVIIEIIYIFLFIDERKLSQLTSEV